MVNIDDEKTLPLAIWDTMPLSKRRWNFLPLLIYPQQHSPLHTFLSWTARRECPQIQMDTTNFLRLLQHAVSLDTQILSLTWDPMLEKVRPDGVIGSVNQNLLNSQVTFTFKRFKSKLPTQV
jgi:hypothetical protein